MQIQIQSCPEGCMGTDGPPYCHCMNCGETGIPLNAEGYCGDCLALDIANDLTEDQRYPYGSFANWGQVLDWLRY